VPSHHLNVVLSKAALSGPSVCLRARAPCPLRVSCPVTDRAQSAQLCAPSRIARARSPAARSRASCGSLGQDKPVSPPHTRPAQELQRHQGRHEPVGKVQCTLGAKQIAESGNFKGRSKRFELLWRFLHHYINRGIVSIKAIKRSLQLADIGTASRGYPQLQQMGAVIHGEV